MKARRILVRLLIGLLVPILVGIVIVWFALSSETAARKLIAFGLERSGNQVAVGEVQGRLRGPLVLRRVAVHTEAMRATVDSIRLEWTPVTLIRRELQIDRLHVTGVHVVLPDSTPAKRDTVPPTRPRLPLMVVFGDVSARDIAVDAPGGVTLRSGAIRLGGRSTDYAIDARGDAATPKVKAIHLEVRGRGNLERLTGLSATADLLDGRVTVAGPVRWWPKVGWDLSLAADRIHPAAMLTEPKSWPGTLMLRGATAGTLDSTGPAGRITIDTLGGSLKGQPVRGQAKVAFADSVYRVDTLSLSWGSATLSASGNAGDSLDLRYRMSVRNLGTLMPKAAGRLEAAGTATGPRAAARLRVQMKGQGLASGSNRFARLAGRADVDLAPEGRNDVELRGDGARAGTQPIEHIVLSLRGTRREHRATARVLAPTAQVELALAGGLEGKEWNGQIVTAELTGSSAGGDWRLERAASLRASDSAASLQQVCLRNQSRNTGRVCAGGDWHGASGWRASAIIEHMPLALADSLLPAGDSLSGTLEARLDAVAVGRALTAHAVLTTSAAAFHYRDVSAREPRRVALDTAGVDVRAGRAGVHGTVIARASDGEHSVGNLDARLALPDYRRLGAPLNPQRVDARIDGSIADLAILRTFTTALDSIAGNVKLGVTAAGTVGAPQVNGSLGLNDLRLWLPENRSVTGSLAATLRAAVARDRRLTAELRAAPREVRLGYLQDSTRRQLTVNGGGLEVHAGADGVRGKVDVGLGDSAGARLASLEGTLELPQYTSFGAPLRTQPVALRLNGQIPDLGIARGLMTQVDSLAGTAAFDLSVDGTGDAPRVAGKLRMEKLMARLPQGARVTGALAGDVRAAVARDSSLDAEISLIPRGIAVEYAPDSVPRRMTLDTTGLVVRAARDGVRGAVDLHLRDSTAQPLATLTGRIALPRYTKLGAPIPPQPVSAKLDGRVDDLSIARAFSAEVDSLAGRIRLSATLTGTAGKPQLVGGLQLDSAAANVPRLGLRIRELGLSAKGDQAGRVSLDASLRSGNGVLTLRGTSPVRPKPEDPGRLHIQGDSVEAVNTGDIRVLVSPNLDVVMTGDSTDAGGEVMVPYAHVELSEIPQTAVPPSDDVVFTDTVAAKGARQRVTARIRVVLGDSVSFKGFNFTADLGGNLLAVSVPNRPATGSGAIVIKRGQYKAYGQDLTISDGRIRFAGGPVDNPGLDIRATRTAQDSVVAGVQIRGTLKAPQVTIFSEPAMEQGRALQYLVLGHPLGETSGTQGSLASKAASSLGLRGGNLLARSVGKGVGLDEAQIETKGDLKEASFVAGKYLSPNLYVSYGIGLFDPVSTLRLRYVLSSKWTLQAETGTGTGADLLYRFESGR